MTAEPVSKYVVARLICGVLVGLVCWSEVE